MNIANVRELNGKLSLAHDHLEAARELITQASTSELDDAAAKALEIIECNTNGAMDVTMALRRSLRAREEKWIGMTQSMDI